MLADPDVMQYHNLDRLTTTVQALDLITRVNDRFRRGEAIRWAIARHDDRRLIGTCGYTELDMASARGRIGYDLRRSAWGQGIMTEALRAVIHYGLTDLGLHRIEALVMLENSASMRTLCRLGFHAEGTLRDYGHWKGRFWDLRLFSLLAPEWLAAQNSAGNR